MRAGWIMLHRRLQDHWLWNNERYSKGQAWVDLLLLASHSDHEMPRGNQLIPVKRGQVLTSQQRLAAKWLWTRKSVNAFLTMLKRDNQVDIRTSRETETGYTLITIKNYDKFNPITRTEIPEPEANGGDIGEPIRGTSEVHPRDTINKGKKGNKHISEPKPGSAHQEIMAHYSRLFEEKFQRKPIITGGRDGKIVKDLLTAGEEPKEIMALLTRFFDRGTKYVRDQGKYDLPAFKASINELIVSRAQEAS